MAVKIARSSHRYLLEYLGPYRLVAQILIESKIRGSMLQ